MGLGVGRLRCSRLGLGLAGGGELDGLLGADSEEFGCGGVDHIDSDAGHAFMVAEGADFFLAWAAIYVDADFSFEGVVGVGPAFVG